MGPLFFELFEGLPRQGPGSAACTQRALALCEGLPEAPRILDLGCGAGIQTLELAGVPGAQVVAIDLHPPLIQELQGRLQAGGIGNVEARVGNMLALPDLGAFDLVWSEGALYSVGLKKALAACKEQLTPGGLLAFTDAVWHSEDPPEAAKALFADYPGMTDVQGVLSHLEAGGWSPLAHFDLPASAWWDDFYTPMERRIEQLRRKYAGDADAQASLDTLAEEPALHRSSGHTYGYTFFVARRG